MIYLESTPMGKPFYEKHGFREIGSFTSNLSKYQADAGEFRMSLMSREAQVKWRRFYSAQDISILHETID
jgi:hypothetical protein